MCAQLQLEQTFLYSKMQGSISLQFLACLVDNIWAIAMPPWGSAGIQKDIRQSKDVQDVDVLSNIQTNCRQTQNQLESHAYCAMGAWSALEGVSHGDEIYGAEMFKGMPPCQKKIRTPVVGYRGIRISILPYLAQTFCDLYRSMFLYVSPLP